jgi:hypothetical protein
MAADVLVSRDFEIIAGRALGRKDAAGRKHRAIGCHFRADSPANRCGAAARAVG